MYVKPAKLSNFDDIGVFHERFGLPNNTYQFQGPREVPKELLEFRIKFLLEELQEFMEATGFGWDEDFKPVRYLRPTIDHAEAFDALLDLVVVAMGTAHLFGYPWQEGWDRVQAANMAKIRAAKDGSDSKRGSSYDIVKPEGWEPPDISELLGDHGWPITEEYSE